MSRLLSPLNFDQFARSTHIQYQKQAVARLYRKNILPPYTNMGRQILYPQAKSVIPEAQYYVSVSLTTKIPTKNKTPQPFLLEANNLGYRGNLFLTAWEPYYINKLIHVNLIYSEPDANNKLLQDLCINNLFPVFYADHFQGGIKLKQIPIHSKIKELPLTKFYQRYAERQFGSSGDFICVPTDGETYYCPHCFQGHQSVIEMQAHMNWCLPSAYQRHLDGLPISMAPIFTKTFIDDYFKVLILENGSCVVGDMRKVQEHQKVFIDPAKTWLNYVGSLYLEETMDSIAEKFAENEYDFETLAPEFVMNCLNLAGPVVRLPCRFCDTTFSKIIPTFQNRSLMADIGTEEMCHSCGNSDGLIIYNINNVKAKVLENFTFSISKHADPLLPDSGSVCSQFVEEPQELDAVAVITSMAQCVQIVEVSVNEEVQVNEGEYGVQLTQDGNFEDIPSNSIGFFGRLIKVKQARKRVPYRFVDIDKVIHYYHSPRVTGNQLAITPPQQQQLEQLRQDLSVSESEDEYSDQTEDSCY